MMANRSATYRLLARHRIRRHPAARSPGASSQRQHSAFSTSGTRRRRGWSEARSERRGSRADASAMSAGGGGVRGTGRRSRRLSRRLSPTWNRASVTSRAICRRAASGVSVETPSQRASPARGARTRGRRRRGAMCAGRANAARATACVMDAPRGLSAGCREDHFCASRAKILGGQDQTSEHQTRTRLGVS